ncbi:hypothetical protein SDC9_56812 [bioreactor metagenome]|uniref:Uncharacterized protein n=1 Tax=bioreactor metagenome TaxID=1076179 RepID=A0A644X2V4_9ZZZZ
MLARYFAGRLLRQRLDGLVFSQVGVELRLVGVALGLDDLVDHVHENRNVHRQRERTEHGVDYGVVGGLHHLDARILEGRERLGKHAPDGQRLRAVLQPRALAEREGAKRRRKEQRKTRVERVRRDAVVGIGEVPDVVGDDPEPEHVRPEHVAAGVELRLFADHDAEPARDGDDVEDARGSVEEVPNAAGNARDFAFDGAGERVPILRANLEVAHAGFKDVDREDQRREEQSDLVVRKPPGDFAGELILFLDVPDAPKADAARGGGVDFHQVEPVGVGLFLEHREPQHGEHGGQNHKAQKPGPFPAAREFVKRKQRRENRQPDAPDYN